MVQPVGVDWPAYQNEGGKAAWRCWADASPTWEEPQSIIRKARRGLRHGELAQDLRDQAAERRDGG